MSGTIRVLAEQGIPHAAAPYQVRAPDLGGFRSHCRLEDICCRCGAPLDPWHERGSTAGQREEHWGALLAQVRRLPNSENLILVGGPACLACAQAFDDFWYATAETPCPPSST